MECIPFACPSCGARMYFVQETKATTYDMWLLCPNCGSKYAYDVRQAGPMQAVTECGEKLGTD